MHNVLVRYLKLSMSCYDPHAHQGRCRRRVREILKDEKSVAVRSLIQKLVNRGGPLLVVRLVVLVLSDAAMHTDFHRLSGGLGDTNKGGYPQWGLAVQCLALIFARPKPHTLTPLELVLHVRTASQ